MASTANVNNSNKHEVVDFFKMGKSYECIFNNGESFVITKIGKNLIYSNHFQLKKIKNKENNIEYVSINNNPISMGIVADNVVIFSMDNKETGVILPCLEH